MIIECPNCAKIYKLPQSMVELPGYNWQGNGLRGDSLQVRCENCGYQWWHEGSSKTSDFSKQTTKIKPTPPIITESRATVRKELAVNAADNVRHGDFIIPTNKDRIVNNSKDTSKSQDKRIKQPYKLSLFFSFLKGNGKWFLSALSTFIILTSLWGVGYLYWQPLSNIFATIIGKQPIITAQSFLLDSISYKLSPSLNPEDDSQLLTVEGFIINPNPNTLSAPLLRVTVWARPTNNQSNNQLSDGNNQDYLYLEWFYRPIAPTINSLEKLFFQTSYPVSADVKRVEVSIS